MESYEAATYETVTAVYVRDSVTLNPQHVKILTGGTPTEKIERSVAVLIVMEEPGRVRLLPWEGNGTRVEATRLDLLKDLEDNSGDQDVFDVLLAIDLRYRKVWLETSLEMPLELTVRVHIFEDKQDGICYVVRTKKNELEIWSRKYKDERTGDDSCFDVNEEELP